MNKYEVLEGIPNVLILVIEYAGADLHIGTVDDVHTRPHLHTEGALREMHAIRPLEMAGYPVTSLGTVPVHRGRITVSQRNGKRVVGGRSPFTVIEFTTEDDKVFHAVFGPGNVPIHPVGLGLTGALNLANDAYRKYAIAVGLPAEALSSDFGNTPTH